MCLTCGCSSHNHGGRDSGDGHHHHGDHDHHHGHDHPDDGPDHQQAKAGAARKIAVQQDILAKNDRLASGNRDLFREKGIFALNLVSSPGSGKTAILERTLRELSTRVHCAVIEGDQQTDNDAVRIAATGVPAVQINTGAGCHLDAHMVSHAVGDLQPRPAATSIH